jgi:hypothetical protein
MMPWLLKLPSCAASSTTTSGRLCAVAAADSLVSKSVSVKNVLIVTPVFRVNASKMAWYALGESLAPRTQTSRVPPPDFPDPAPEPDPQAASSSALAANAVATLRTRRRPDAAMSPPFRYVNAEYVDEHWAGNIRAGFNRGQCGRPPHRPWSAAFRRAFPADGKAPRGYGAATG